MPPLRFLPKWIVSRDLRPTEHTESTGNCSSYYRSCMRKAETCQLGPESTPAKSSYTDNPSPFSIEERARIAEVTTALPPPYYNGRPTEQVLERSINGPHKSASRPGAIEHWTVEKWTIPRLRSSYLFSVLPVFHPSNFQRSKTQSAFQACPNAPLLIREVSKLSYLN